MEKTKTYIEGLDELIEDGLVKNSVILLAGKTGTGKTSFSMSYIYNGAKNNEPSIYVSTEENEEDIKCDAKETFGWDLEELESKNMLRIKTIKPEFPTQIVKEDEARIVKLYIYDLMDQISNCIKEINGVRVVIDSTSILELLIRDKYLARVAMMYLIDNLKKSNVTSILTGTIPEDSNKLSSSGIIEYLVDGIIKLDFVPIAEEYKRTLTIRKMRRVNHSTLIHPFEISKGGIKILKI
ncbi:MAG: hypothetical protein B6U88_00775 [Candidatus Aenigmarchaeota archaeon ex4484_56]|nr:MAG: hypothetical protein B6U88_00775 [Candidatus Aenigmarchaeota archaeon ex4484_56]